MYFSLHTHTQTNNILLIQIPSIPYSIHSYYHGTRSKTKQNEKKTKMFGTIHSLKKIHYTYTKANTNTPSSSVAKMMMSI